ERSRSMWYSTEIGAARASAFEKRRAFTSFFFSSRRRHTRSKRDWSSDVCSSDLFECRPWVKGVLLIAGGWALENSAYKWCADHELGRASCRERVWIREVSRPLTATKQHNRYPSMQSSTSIPRQSRHRRFGT